MGTLADVAANMAGGMDMKKCWARIKTQWAGLHCYPGAPENVAFLRHPHRHVFVIQLWVEQRHEERDVEYLTCLNWLNAWLQDPPWPLAASCETMARCIVEAVAGQWPNRSLRVEVSEDGENGALVEWEPAAAPGY